MTESIKESEVDCSETIKNGAHPKGEDEGNNDKDTMDLLYKMLRTETFGLGKKSVEKAIKKKVPMIYRPQIRDVFADLTFDGLTERWKKQGFKNIITMVGAGISTSAGIPDFRSPGSGLYNNLQKYELPYPSAIFDLEYFRENPTPFFDLAKELYPGNFHPTMTHYFVRMLHEKGLLLRHYTQNIDGLERTVGIPDEKLVEAHGSFFHNHCLQCHKKYCLTWMKTEIQADRVPRCKDCQSIVKPDIVFFGENLPKAFFDLPEKDFRTCDLLIIMGTSLKVQPFASLIEYAGKECFRLLINREKVGHNSSFGKHSLKYDHPSNSRDIVYLGDCDEGVKTLSQALGWYNDLCDLMKREEEH